MRCDFTRCNWCIRIMATTDPGSRSSNWCRIISRCSTTLIQQWRTPMYQQREWWSLVGACVRQLKYGVRITVGWFLSLRSLLLIFGSRPGIIKVGTGFTTFVSHSMGYGGSLCTGSTESSPWVVLNSCGTYGFKHLGTLNGCLIASFPFLSFPTLGQDFASHEVCTYKGG